MSVTQHSASWNQNPNSEHSASVRSPAKPSPWGMTARGPPGLARLLPSKSSPGFKKSPKLSERGGHQDPNSHDTIRPQGTLRKMGRFLISSLGYKKKICAISTQWNTTQQSEGINHGYTQLHGKSQNSYRLKADRPEYTLYDSI